MANSTGRFGARRDQLTISGMEHTIRTGRAADGSPVEYDFCSAIGGCLPVIQLPGNPLSAAATVVSKTFSQSRCLHVFDARAAGMAQELLAKIAGMPVARRNLLFSFLENEPAVEPRGKDPVTLREQLDNSIRQHGEVVLPATLSHRGQSTI